MVNFSCVAGKTQFNPLLHDVHVLHVIVNIHNYNVRLVRSVTSQYSYNVFQFEEEIFDESSITVYT